jgi:hypothetical protein
MKPYLALCLFLCGFNTLAALNKWVDADGKVHYSDTPPPDVTVKRLRSSNVTEAATETNSVAPEKTLAEKEAEWKKSQKTKEEANQKAAQEQEAILTKKKNCDTSRNYLEKIENSPLVAQYNAQGERTIMDEAGRLQRIEEARKAVAAHCN